MRCARPLVLTVAAALLAGPLVPGVAAAAAAPTVSITSPTAAASVTGSVTVSIAGDVDTTDIAHAQTALLVDGTALGAPQPCGTAIPGGADCPTSFTWDTTGLNGPYTLTAQLTVPSQPATHTDASVTVTAVNPLPKITITSPAPGAVVKGGALTLHATGTVDLSQSDQPASLQLWVDGARYGLPQTCTVVVTTVKACDAAFTVSQPTWSGTHTAQVTMTTTRSTATTDTVGYVFFTRTRTTLARIATVRSGKQAVVKGAAVNVNNGSPLAGARVAVTLTPAIGKKKTVVVRTGTTGHFSLASKVAANTTVTATVVPTSGYAASHASAKAAVTAPIVCKADKQLRHGRAGNGSCTVSHLPNGTRVTLQYQAKKKWHTLGSSTTKGTTLLISYTFNGAGSYPVRLVLGANKIYAATYQTPFVVKVS